MLFTLEPEAYVITYNRGVFQQRKIYFRGRDVYAQYGVGFIRLVKGGTVISNLGVDTLYLPFIPNYNSLGYMMKPEVT